MSFLRGTAAILAAHAIILASGYTINFVLARKFGPELYGVFGILMVLWTMLTLFLGTGIAQAASHFTSLRQERAQTIKRKALQLQLLLSGGVLAAAFFLAPLLGAALHDAALSSYFRLFIPPILLYTMVTVYGGHLLGRQRFGEQAILLGMYGIGRAAFVILLGSLFFINGVAYGTLAAVLITAAYGWWRSIGRGEGSFPMTRLASFGLPATLFATLFMLSVSVDLLLVKVLLNDNVLVGHYTAASTIARTPYFLFSALAVTVLPKLSHTQIREGMESVRKTVPEVLRYVAIAATILALLVSMTATGTVTFFYRAAYEAAGQPLSILIIGTTLFSVMYVLAAIINSLGKPTISLAAIAVALITAIGSALALIPSYGLVGAAIATTAGSVVGILLAGTYLFKKIGTLVPLRSLASVAVAGAAAVLSLHLAVTTNKFMLPLTYAAVTSIYVGVLLLMREVTAKDVQRLRSFLPHAGK